MKKEKKYEKPPRLSRILSHDEIGKVIEVGGLASISLRLPVACNLNCRYCYGNQNSQGLKYGEITGVLQEAFELGAKSVSIVGEGEPLLYSSGGKDIFSLIDFIDENQADTILYSNCTLVTPGIADRLYERNVVVVGKQNSLDPSIQEFLTGVGTWEKMSIGLRNLKAAGFNKTDPSRMSIHSVISQINYHEIPVMWRIWRRENIIPYIQVTVPPKDYNEQFYLDQYVSPSIVRTLFHTLSKIGSEEFGFNWDPDWTYPIAALGCNVVKTGCGITPAGEVQLCAYTEHSLGNVKEQSLREIIKSREVKRIREAEYHDLKTGKNKYFY
ncbi:MAG: radical SAM protein, partial [Candidatus Altiarchaeota archaeon]